mgnify:CR=1 FL=1
MDYKNKIKPQLFKIHGTEIKLDQFLKWSGIASTGGEGKELIQLGYVLVNGVVETRRGKKLHLGDKVFVKGITEFPYEVVGDKDGVR